MNWDMNLYEDGYEEEEEEEETENVPYE